MPTETRSIGGPPPKLEFQLVVSLPVLVVRIEREFFLQEERRLLITEPPLQVSPTALF